MNRANKVFIAAFGSAMMAGTFAASHVAADNPGGWEYSVAPLYLWAKSIEGSSRLGPVAAPLDLDFKDDVLENLDGAFAIHFEAKQGDLTLFAEYNYAKLDPSAEASFGPVTVKADIEFTDIMLELGFTYAFAETESTVWEVLGGVRRKDQDIELSIGSNLDQGLIPDSSGGDAWWHGFGGFRVVSELSENWKLRARADFGYNDSNNKASQAMATVDYRFRDWGSFFAGYRYMDFTYDNGESGRTGYGYNAEEQGPILGINLYF